MFLNSDLISVTLRAKSIGYTSRATVEGEQRLRKKQNATIRSRAKGLGADGHSRREIENGPVEEQRSSLQWINGKAPYVVDHESATSKPGWRDRICFEVLNGTKDGFGKAKRKS